MEITVTTRSYQPAARVQRDMFDCFRKMGKDARSLDASRIDVVSLCGIPTLDSNGKVVLVGAAWLSEVEVLVVTNIGEALYSTRDRLLSIAGNIEVNRVLFPKLESVLFV